VKTFFALCLSACCCLGQAFTFNDPAFLGQQGGTVTPLLTVTTDASATPTTTLLTVPSSLNAVRIWTGETPQTESSFPVYFRRNGGAVQTVNMSRWQGRILNAAAGDTIQIGTSDGRTLQIAAMKTPAALIAPYGSTNNANCDKAGPPIWTPSTPQVTLATNNSAFSVATNAAEMPLFISEFDGYTWSYPRWVWTQTNAQVRVQCTYRQVALANYAGTPVSIISDASAVVGGTSATMTLGLPTPTGTTRTCSTVNDFEDAIKNSVSGDRIALNAGVYSLTNSILSATFAANNGVNGKHGMEGIEIVGLGTHPSDVVITATNSSYLWFLDHSTASGYAWFNNLSFQPTNGAGIIGISFASGKWNLENVLIQGSMSQGKVFAHTVDIGDPIFLDALFLTVTNSADDCISVNGDSVGSAACLGSRIRFIACTAATPGAANNDQCFTAHTGMSYYVYGGAAYDAYLNVVANQDDNEVAYLNFLTITPGSGGRDAGCQNMNMYGCYYLAHTGGFTPVRGGYVQECRLYDDGTLNSFYAEVNGSAYYYFGHNLMSQLGAQGSTRGAYCRATNAVFVGNICTNFSNGVQAQYYSGGPIGTYKILGNTFKGSSIALNIFETAGPITQATNNACLYNATSVATTAGAMAYLQSDYNVLNSSVYAAYVAGAHDTVNVNASLDSNYLPASSGNCDGTGLQTYGFVGETDPFGWVWLYQTNAAPRGARSLPAVIAGAILFPDLY